MKSDRYSNAAVGFLTALGHFIAQWWPVALFPCMLWNLWTEAPLKGAWQFPKLHSVISSIIELAICLAALAVMRKLTKTRHGVDLFFSTWMVVAITGVIAGFFSYGVLAIGLPDNIGR